MHLFLTGVLPFLAHNHGSAAAFLTSRSHNFHASIIPEFLSNEERVKSFCEARQLHQVDDKRVKSYCELRQRDQFIIDIAKQYKNLYNLFVQTPLMQFSPSLVLHQNDCDESILKPLLETKYFTRTLQRCTVDCAVCCILLRTLSKVQSLTELNFGECKVVNEHMEIIVNSFSSLETLTIYRAKYLDSTTAISISSPPPPATTTLRSLTLKFVDPLFATQFIPQFPNLRKLLLTAENPSEELDLLPFSCSLPLLTDLELDNFYLENIDSLTNLVDLSSLECRFCRMPDSLSFLAQESTSPPELKTLCIEFCKGVPTSSFASLSHTPNLNVLHVVALDFDNDCLQYLENMVHLRKLELSHTKIVGDSRSLKTWMQNSFQLEELNLQYCRIGNQGAVAGSLYNNHSRLRVLKLSNCDLVDDDLNGIGALKNTLKVLDLEGNNNLTNEGLRHCRDLATLKVLDLWSCVRIGDLSPLKDCFNLEELNVLGCKGLSDDSFRVFSEEPNSFPNLRVLTLSRCEKLTEKVFEHLSKNNHLVFQLKELEVGGMNKFLISSSSARNNICQLKGLRRLSGRVVDDFTDASNEEIEAKRELMLRLRNIENIR